MPESKDSENSSLIEDFLGLVIALLLWAILFAFLPQAKAESYYVLVLLAFLGLSGVATYLMVTFAADHYRAIARLILSIRFGKKPRIYLVVGLKNAAVVKNHFHGFGPKHVVFGMLILVIVGLSTALIVTYGKSAVNWMDGQANASFDKEPPAKKTVTQKPKTAWNRCNKVKTFSLYDQEIARISAKYGVDPAMTKSIIHTESAFRWCARSPKGAEGLMQLMPDTQKDMGVRDSTDPVQNIEGGVKYYKRLLNQYKDKRIALAAYNAGPEKVRKYNGIPPYKETRNYIRRVLALHSDYRRQKFNPPSKEKVVVPDGKRVQVAQNSVKDSEGILDAFFRRFD